MKWGLISLTSRATFSVSPRRSSLPPRALVRSSVKTLPIWFSVMTMGPEDSLAWGLQQTLVEGSKGTLRIRGDGQIERNLPDGSTDIYPVKLDEDPRVQAYASTQRHFLDCLHSGEPFLTDICDNRRAMAIVHAGYESARKRQVIVLR
jgi:predicted dehydrogenase